MLISRPSPTSKRWRQHHYHLVVATGVYMADTLPGLVWQVLRHRLAHWWQGDGWVD